MKLNYNFVINEVADKFVAVAVGDDLEKFNGFIKLNEAGKFIFEILKNDVTEDEIVAAMLEQYEETEQEIRENVSDFITTLNNSGVLS